MGVGGGGVGRRVSVKGSPGQAPVKRLQNRLHSNHSQQDECLYCDGGGVQQTQQPRMDKLSERGLLDRMVRFLLYNSKSAECTGVPLFFDGEFLSHLLNRRGD